MDYDYEVDETLSLYRVTLDVAVLSVSLSASHSDT
jgi:hypothetical protein